MSKVVGSPEEQEGTEICRLCETAVLKGTFETHSIFCLIGQQAAIQISSIDESLSELVEDLDTAIYTAAHNYLRRFIKDKEALFGDHTIILTDNEFHVVREITVKIHQILKLHELSHRALSQLDVLTSELDTLVSHNRSKFQPAVLELLEKIQELSKSKFMHVKSNHSACIALLDTTEDSISVLETEKESAEYFQVAQKSFKARYSESKPSLEDFLFIRAISKGAFGQVFLAKHKRTNDLLAIKVLKKNNILRRKSIKRVNDEHKILQSANNPFIVKLFYSFQSEENLFLVMEYLPGGDLLSLLENIGYFDIEIAQFYLAEIVLALEYLHKHGIIHRDLKPDNCIITKEGHVKLTDFGLSAIGLSQVLHLEGLDEVSPDSPQPPLQQLSRRQRAYSCVGTPDYLAPEILQGNGYDNACDFWSLGAMSYEFLTGAPPFNDENPDGVFQKILDPNFSPDWPDDIDIPDAAKDFVMNLLIRDPHKRLGVRKGIEEIKNHPFFANISWNSLLEEQPIFKPNEGVNYFVDIPFADSHKSVDVDINKLNINLKKLQEPFLSLSSSGEGVSPKTLSPGNMVSPRNSPRGKAVTAFPSFQFRNLNF
jgi:serine/threonine protein kinase